MSVLSFGEEDLFVVRTIKSLTTNPNNKWANSYEFVSTAVGTETTLLTLATAVIEFEATLSLSTVRFDRVTVSTWAADSVPYNPETFISTTVTAEGEVTPATDQLPLNQCMSVARVAASGRFGHLFYRGLLVEGDVTAPAGIQVLVNRPGKQTDVEAALASSGLAEYIGTSHTAELVLCMISKDGFQVRIVEELLVQGVSTIPQDHAWFNRTSP